MSTAVAAPGWSISYVAGEDFWRWRVWDDGWTASGAAVSGDAARAEARRVHTMRQARGREDG